MYVAILFLVYFKKEVACSSLLGGCLALKVSSVMKNIFQCVLPRRMWQRPAGSAGC